VQQLPPLLPSFEDGGSLIDDIMRGGAAQSPAREYIDDIEGYPGEQRPPEITRQEVLPPEGVPLDGMPQNGGLAAPGSFAAMCGLGSWVYNNIRLPRFAYRDPDDPNRHTGAGEPLNGTSWRNRPLHADVFFGGLFADDFVAGEVSQGAGEFAGVRIGADFDHFWGVDFRYALADLPLSDRATGHSRGSSHNQFYDLQLVHYPWGDSRWRPFFAIGLGLAKIESEIATESLVQIPLGLGLKYFWYPWLALRFDAYTNLTIPGHHIESVYHGSFTIGLEWRFGGRRKSYFPYHPGKYMY